MPLKKIFLILAEPVMGCVSRGFPYVLLMFCGYLGKQ